MSLVLYCVRHAFGVIWGGLRNASEPRVARAMMSAYTRTRVPGLLHPQATARCFVYACMYMKRILYLSLYGATSPI
jgi:hypothetical protein